VSAHAVPFKEAVIKIEQKGIYTENSKKKEKGNNKQIPFVLKMFLP
jgi:hypothetical protein